MDYLPCTASEKLFVNNYDDEFDYVSVKYKGPLMSFFYIVHN